MRVIKKLQREIDKWINNNGACKIDIKEENIELFNGGLFEDMDESKATLWIGNLDDTIRYLRRLKRFLNKNGFNTRRSANDYISDKKLNRVSKDSEICKCGHHTNFHSYKTDIKDNNLYCDECDCVNFINSEEIEK